MTFALYLDDDQELRALARQALRFGWDVLPTTEAGMRGKPDAEHLEFATKMGRVLFSANISDFSALHTLRMEEDRTHAGIILNPQQQLPVGEVLRRLERLMAARTAEDMVNRLSG